MKKILLAGSGQFASNWVQETKKLHRNFVVSKSPNANFSKSYFTEDLADFKKSQELIKTLQPDLIINAAACTDIELCEKFPDLAFRSNVVVPKNLSLISSEFGIPLIHISTDHFASAKGELRNELVKTQSVNQYGWTKLQGENEIIRNTQNYSIIRTNFFSIYEDKNFSSLSKIINNLRNGESYSGAIDYYFNPVSINFLIEVILKLIDSKMIGILNVTSDECISKYDFAVNVCKNLKLNEEKIIKIALKDMDGITERPHNLCLANNRLKELFTIKEINVYDQLKALMSEAQIR
jgi:dTDP-4-dehydrorhamnose reductase